MGLKKHNPGCGCCDPCFLFWRQGGTGADDWALSDDFTVSGSYVQSFSYLHPSTGMVAISSGNDDDPDRVFFTVSTANAGDKFEIYVAYTDANNYLRCEIEMETPGAAHKGFNTVKFYQAASGVETQLGSTHNWHNVGGTTAFECCYTDEGYDGNGVVRCSIYPDDFGTGGGGFHLLDRAGAQTVYSFSEQVTTSGTKVGFGFPNVQDARTIDVWNIGWFKHNDEQSNCPDCGEGCETNDWDANPWRRNDHDATTFAHVFENIDSGTVSDATDDGETIGVEIDTLDSRWVAYSESADTGKHDIRAKMRLPNNAGSVGLLFDYYDSDNYHLAKFDYVLTGDKIVMSLFKMDDGVITMISTDTTTGVSTPSEIELQVCYESDTTVLLATEVSEMVATTSFHDGRKIGVQKTTTDDCIVEWLVAFKSLGRYTTDKYGCHGCKSYACNNCDADLVVVELSHFSGNGSHACDLCDELLGTYILSSQKTYASDPWERVECHWKTTVPVYGGKTLTLRVYIRDGFWWGEKNVTVAAQINDGCINNFDGFAPVKTGDVDCAFNTKIGMYNTTDPWNRSCNWLLQARVAAI